MWAQVNELLFKKYFGTHPVTPLHNLYPSKPIFTRPKDGWLAKCLITTRDVNRKPEIWFSVLKLKSGFRFWKPNFEFFIFYFFTYGKLHKDESKFLKRLIHGFA